MHRPAEDLRGEWAAVQVGGEFQGEAGPSKIMEEPQWDYSFLAYQIKITSEPQVLSRQEEL